MQKYKKNMNMPSILRKIRQFLSRKPVQKASGHRSSGYCRKATKKVGNGFSGVKLPFGKPPDHRRPEIPLKEVLAMAREWQDEMQRWTETLKRQTP